MYIYVCIICMYLCMSVCSCVQYSCNHVSLVINIFKQLRARTYREAAKALMHPIEMLDKETRKRFQRSKKDFNGAAVINSNAYNNGDDEEQSSSPGSGVIRHKGKGRASQDGENCSLS